MLSARYFRLFFDGEVKFYDLQHEDKKYRFKDLLQIRQEGKLTNFAGAPTKDGDSGAWICTPHPCGVAWCGMIIGGFEQTGYAISADKIMDWIKKETKLDLALI